MFTVIIPVYNKAPFVKKSIASVLNQTWKNFELLIINDGSTDDSITIIEYFNDARIRLINQENSGVSVARNNGVEAAKYNYIAFLDADDWWAPEFLERMKEFIECYPNSGIYASSFYQVKNNNIKVAPIGLPENFQKGEINYVEVYTKTFCMPLHCNSIIIPKSIYSQLNGFKGNLKMGEDFDLWIRLALSYPISFLNKPLMYYNQDIDVSLRAVGNYDLFSPKNHFVFNLSYLKPNEDKDPVLKSLLDGLRVRSLLPYYLQKKYLNEIGLILSEINFSDQPFLYKFIYKAPFVVVKLFFKYKVVGSFIKQTIIKLFN